MNMFYEYINFITVMLLIRATPAAARLSPRLDQWFDVEAIYLMVKVTIKAEGLSPRT